MATTLEIAKSLLSPPGDTIQEHIDFIGMSQVELAERMVQAIGTNASLQVVKNSGHTPHIEQADVFAESIRSFVKQTS